MRRFMRALIFVLCCFLVINPLPARACSLPPPNIHIRCTLQTGYYTRTICFGSDCSTRFLDNGRTLVSSYLPIHSIEANYAGLFIYAQGTQHIPELLTAIETLCSQDLRAIRAILLPLLEQHIIGGSSDAGLGSLTVQPFDMRDIAPLQQQHNNYFACRYLDFHHADTWLIIQERTRSYCQWSFRPGFPCQSFDISILQWLWFLRYPSEWAIAPYLLSTLAVLGLLCWRIASRIRQWRWTILRPSFGGLLLTIIGAGVSTILLGAVNFWLIVIILYLLVGNLRRRSRQPPTPEPQS